MAQAQTPVAAPASSIPASMSADKDNSAISDIVVTAQKRAVSVQKIPTTVAVYDGPALQQLRVTTFDTLNAIDPALSIERGEGGNTVVSIRGFGTTSSAQSFEQSVAPYINGVYAGGNVREFASPLYDLERVEVLKGTQSGISGQNTSVGAINIVTRQPESDLGGYLRLGHEFSYDGWNAEGAIDLPVSQNFAIRLTGFYEDSDGYLNNIATGNRPGSGRTYSGRINARWQASDAVKVSLYAQYDDGGKLGSTLVTFGTPTPTLLPFISKAKTSDVAKFSSRSDNGGDSGYSYDNLRGSLTIDVDLNGPTLTSVTAASRIDDTLSVDPDFSVIDLQWLYQKSRYTQVHQELRLVSPTDQRLSYILGAWFRHAKQDKSIAFYLDNPLPAPSFRADIPFLQKTDTVSVFGDLGYKLSDTLSIGGTLRYTSEKKKAVAQSISNWPFVFTPFPLSRGTLSPNFVDGSARIQYEPTDRIMTYALYARGTKTGSFLDLAGSFISARPEKATTYEIGAKTRFPSLGLTVNASLFRLEVDDYQDAYTTVVNGAIGFISENRDVYTQGLEFSLNLRPDQRLTLGFSGIAMDSHDETGGRAVRAPHWSLNGNFRYALPLPSAAFSLELFSNASYRSLYFNRPLSVGPAAYTTRTPKYALLDIGVIAKMEHGLSAQLLVKNVTDTYTHLAVETLTSDTSQRLANQLPLRQFFLTLGYDF